LIFNFILNFILILDLHPSFYFFILCVTSNKSWRAEDDRERQ
jgi:hypothetical protein